MSAAAPRRLFAVLLIATAVYRFSFLGRGALALVDETFYFTSVKAMVCELYPGTSYASPGPIDRATNAPYRGDSDYVLLNFCQALPEVPRPRWNAFIPEDAVRLFDGPHWMSFPAYAYEGLILADRRAMRRENYRLQVFRVPARTP